MKNSTDIWEKEVHEDWFYHVPKMKALIIGSFPPPRKKWSMEFFYPNKQNNFWPVLAGVAGIELKSFEGTSAVEERKVIMEKLNIGIEDMGKTILRKNDSALDANIRITSNYDILGILSRYKNIKVFITAGFHDDNSAYESLVRYLKEKDILVTLPMKKGAGQRFSFIYEGRLINCIMLNSTSKAARKSLKELIEQYSYGILELPNL